jgi:hypothetical protein
LVSDILAGEGKIANLFYSVGQLQKNLLFCIIDIELETSFLPYVQGTEVFEVEPTTGVVRVARPIDRESQSGISDNEIR